MPDVGQEGNVSLAIYAIPEKKGLMEKSLLNYTHAWFPSEQFDSVYISGAYAMGKKGRAYCALTCKNNLYFRGKTTNNLIQPGKRTFWIIEAGSEKEDHSFKEFKKRILENKCEFDSVNLVLNYHSGGKSYRLNYNNDFRVNDLPVNTKYARFDSPYSKAERKPDKVTFELDGKSLYLDFYKMIRRY